MKFLAIVNNFPLTVFLMGFTMRHRNQDGIPEGVGGVPEVKLQRANLMRRL